jgi:PKD repeat protein
VGQLAGGNDYYEYYGAFHVSWNHEVNNIRQLKHWLDPDNTGTLAVDGKRLNREPVAKFSIDHSSVSHSKVCVNDVNVLTDESYNMPVSWQWNISPSNFDFMNGTGMTSRNPQVKFNAKGYYTVKLRVSNAYGEDSIIKTDFIDAVSSITTSFINPPALSKICGSELNKIPLTAGGANEYIFSCSKSNRVNIESANAYAVLSLNEENKKFGAFTSLLRVDGSVGSCKSFATIPLNVTIPGNDDFRDALLIFPGATNSFDNTCATGEFTEPYPSTFDCTSDHSWCPGTMVNGILNSIWFQFYGPPDGKVSIITSGKNNRIAVYEANIKSDDYSFSNDGITYSIVGSNDNTSFTNKAASLENLKVIPGKKYWLQIESYDVDVGPIDLSIQGKKDIEVYPNPGSGLINLIIPTSDPAIANVNIFSLSGRLVYSNDNSGIASSNPFEIDLSGSPAGMYYIQVKLDNSTYSKKILIVK